VDVHRKGAVDGSRNVELCHGTVRGTHKAVSHRARIVVVSRDSPRWVDTCSDRAFKTACASARSIEVGKGAVASAQKAVGHEVIIEDESHDGSRRAGALRGRTFERACARARIVDRDKGGLALLSGRGKLHFHGAKG